MKNLCIIACILMLFFVPNAASAQQVEDTRGYKFTQGSLDAFRSELEKELKGDGELTPTQQDLLDGLNKTLKAKLLDNEYPDIEKLDIALDYTLGDHLAYKAKVLKHVERIGVNMEKVVDILVMFLVLAVVFEMAFATIFEWKHFQEHLDNMGLKTPIMLILVFLIFGRFHLDIFTDLLHALGKTNVTSGLLGRIATAFLIAGGSKGIWEIFNRLGVRNPYTSHEQPYNPTYRKPKT